MSRFSKVKENLAATMTTPQPTSPDDDDFFGDFNLSGDEDDDDPAQQSYNPDSGGSTEPPTPVFESVAQPAPIPKSATQPKPAKANAWESDKGIAAIVSQLRSAGSTLLKINTNIDACIGKANQRVTDLRSVVNSNVITDTATLNKGKQLVTAKYAALDKQQKADKQMLDTLINTVPAVPGLISNLQRSLNKATTSQTDREAIKGCLEMHYLINNTPVQGGIQGLFNYVVAQYNTKLKGVWNELDTVHMQYQNMLSSKEAEFQFEAEERQAVLEFQMSAEFQSNASLQFTRFGTGSTYGMYIGCKELNQIVVDAIKIQCGSDIKFVQSLGVTDRGDIYINGQLFKMNNQMTLDSEQAQRIPPIYRDEIRAGHWGCVVDFKTILNTFYNLTCLDLSNAPNRKWDAMKELGVTKGNWGKVLKKYNNLQMIKLPEGDLTRANQSVWGQFKSVLDYANHSENAVAQKENRAPRPKTSMADVESGISTFKNLVWKKPLPRTLIKTIGYGAAWPVYWGLMSALGPFALVAGAVGVGVLGIREVKGLKQDLFGK